MQNKIVQHNYGFEVLHYSDEPVYSSEGVSIQSDVVIKNNSGEKIVLLEVLNDTDEIYYFCTNQIKINGLLMFDSRWSGVLTAAHKTAVLDVDIDRVLKKGEEYFPDNFATIGEPAEINIEFDVGDPGNGNVLLEPGTKLCHCNRGGTCPRLGLDILYRIWYHAGQKLIKYRIYP